MDSKPAIGVFTGAVVTLGLSLSKRYTPYEPTLEEAGAILTIFSGLMMWLVPSWMRKKLDSEEPVDETKEITVT